jgi:hypothetical protein
LKKREERNAICGEILSEKWEVISFFVIFVGVPVWLPREEPFYSRLNFATTSNPVSYLVSEALP